jgi:hypothetical protein
MKLVLCGGLAGWHGTLWAQPGMAHDATPTARVPAGGYLKEPEAGIAPRAGVHDGRGSVGLKRYQFGGAARPANFIVYDLPPGSSEGVHTHLADNSNRLGVFDEFYYIVSGRGQMQIGDEIVPVVAGDHVFTPIGTPHGIENVAESEHLKVFLTFIQR